MCGVTRQRPRRPLRHDEDDEKRETNATTPSSPRRGDFFDRYLDDVTRTVLPVGVKLYDLLQLMDPRDVAFFLAQENKILRGLLRKRNS